jgi:tetratricopeptide (TPR) repeat protein
MKINYFFRIVVLFMVFLFTVFIVTPQNLKPDEKLIEEKGILYFNEGEFPKALFYFNKLLGIYPKDPLFNYYAGVSHTEMETQLDEAIYQLKLASLKDVPDNVYFYLGKANHISENYDDALKYYERYLSIGDKNEIEEFQAQRLLQMCRSKVNPETSGPGVEKISSRSGEIPVDGNEAAKTGEEKTTTADRQEITGYDELVKEALKWQIKADSVRRRSNERRQYLPTILVQGEREKVEKEILSFEEEAYNYQTKADELYLRVKDLEQVMKGKPDAALSSFEQNLSHIESQQFIEHLEEVKPFEEQRTGDKFYNTNDYNKFFRLRDLRIIYDGEGYIKEGDNCMKDVSSFQADLEREKVRISSLTNTKDRKKSQKIIML